MHIFVLGATGSIGTPLVAELLSHRHEITALARSAESEAKLERSGVKAVRGDLRTPSEWCEHAVEADVIIQAAATFTADMGMVDLGVVKALIAAAQSKGTSPRFIYTGGCWLYGETGDRLAVETDELKPIPAFRWMAENYRVAQASQVLQTVLIHPAMVYDRDGGVLSRSIEAAKTRGQIEVWGSLDTRWPVVHGDDLASAYRLATEKGKAGDIFNVAAEDGVRVSAIVEAIGKRFSLDQSPLVLSATEAVAKHGDWALGPCIDQRMSGAKIRARLGWSPRQTDILKAVG